MLERGREYHEVPQRVVVEIGTAGINLLSSGDRPKKVGEKYITINLDRKAALQDQKEGIEALQADAARLPFKDSSIDELIYSNVFSHFKHVRDPEIQLSKEYLEMAGLREVPYHSPEELLREAARVIKSDGRIIITNTNTPAFAFSLLGVNQEQRFKPHVIKQALSATPKEYSKRFSQYGLAVEKISTDEKDISQYISPLYQGNYDKNSFQLVLKKLLSSESENEKV